MRNPGVQAGASGDMLVGWSPEPNTEAFNVEQLSRAVDRAWISYQNIQRETQTQSVLLSDARHLAKLAKAHAGYVDAFRAWDEACDVARA